MPDPAPINQLPGATTPATNPETRVNLRLQNTAETIGGAVGTAVGRVRHLPQQLEEMKKRFTVIRGRAREEATTAAVEWKQAARQRVRYAQSRSRALAEERPIEVILAAGAAAFVLGFIFRIWRSKSRA